ncbi:collagen alpha-1(III) chain-like isoform X5 [Dysidea avara]|uniref:collagen alpha-1(III) chain-like isoform X5 n=1 Tax=Dysidea avara TaxID=196820 RepID=UPI00332EFAD2
MKEHTMLKKEEWMVCMYKADDISTKMIGSMSSLVVMVIVLLTVTSGSGYPHSGGTVGDCQKDDNMVQSEAEYSEEHGPNFRVCYTTLYSGKNCELQNETYDTIVSSGSTEDSPFIAYNIQTPRYNRSGIYPNNQYCTYSLPGRQFGFVYTYVYHSIPEIEMEIDIDHIKTVDGPVTTKHCIDCMEHKHSMEDKTTSIIVCGTSTENKLSNGAETLSNITLTFKSDGSVVQQGADFFIIENQIAGEETKNGLYLNPGVTNEAKSQVMAVSGIAGLPGHPGLPGGVGPTGPDGDKGPLGQQGEIGDRGSDGSQGDKGSQGPKGLEGIPGHNGLKGIKGRKGLLGSPGKPCSCSQEPPMSYCKAAKGDHGAPGDVGERGKPGFPSLPGARGKNGLPGPPGDRGRSGNLGNPGRRGLQGEPGPRGNPGCPGISYCPGITEEDIRNMRTIINSSVLVHVSYFNAWRGHLQPHKPYEIIIRHYLPDDFQLNTNNSYNLTDKRFDKSQFQIRRGTSLIAWANSQENILTKLEEYEMFMELRSEEHRKQYRASSNNDLPTTSFFCPKGHDGLPGSPGPNGPPGDKGDRGLAGNPGPKGQLGVPGEHGNKGDPGPLGQKGINGPPGVSGESGPKR